MELLLSGGTTPPDAQGNKYKSPYLEEYKSSVSEKKIKQLNKLWDSDFNLAKLRNDVIHSGFRKKPKSAEDIRHQTEKIIEELKAVAAEWNLADKTL